jgi:streptomycin 6-kinase
MMLYPFDPWIVRWALKVDGVPFKTSSGSHLLPVLRGNQAAMLKIAGNEEERRGGELMEWYGGVGAADVLDREGVALLMERAMGQRSLSHMARNGSDDEATRILCRTAALIHQTRPIAPPESLIPLDVWFRALETASAAYGGTFAKSEAKARSLLDAPGEAVVLHGDFHHDNVMDGGTRGWLAIDPKGLIGEREFEFANLFRNPDAATALASGQMRRRAEIVAQEASLDARRLLRWVVAYAGLGSAWCIEDGQDPATGLAIAEQAVAELAG